MSETLTCERCAQRYPGLPGDKECGMCRPRDGGRDWSKVAPAWHGCREFVAVPTELELVIPTGVRADDDSDDNQLVLF